MEAQTYELGVVEHGILTSIKWKTRRNMEDMTYPDVARALIKAGLIRVAFEHVKTHISEDGEIAELTQVLYLTDVGEAALTGADPGLKLEAAGVDVGVLSERIRQFAENRGVLAELTQQKSDIMTAVESANKDLFETIRAVGKMIKDEEPLLEDEIKKAHGAGVEFKPDLNGIAVQQGTLPVVSDTKGLIKWMVDEARTSLPDVDRKTGQPKLDGTGKPKVIELVGLKNLHKFVARHRDQITMREIPFMHIVETTKIAWASDLPALWEQGIVLAPIKEK